MKKTNNSWMNKAPQDKIDDLPGEVWTMAKYLYTDGKMIDFPFIEVSNMGRIKSIAYQKACFGKRLSTISTHNAKLLKIKPDKNNYAYVEIKSNRKKYRLPVARIVLSSFVPNPDYRKYKHCNHKNENRMDARLCNLEWSTVIANNNYGNHCKNISASLTGYKRTKAEVEKANIHRYKPVKANGIIYKSVKDCAKELGINPSNLSRYLKKGFPKKYREMQIDYAKEV